MISSRWPRPIGRHGVDGLDAGLQRLAHRLSFGHARREELDRPAVGGRHGALAIQRIAQRVEHASHHGVADRDRQQFAQRPDFVALVDVEVVAEDDDRRRCSPPG